MFSIEKYQIEKSNSLSLSQLIKIILYPSDSALYIRNIITSVYHDLDQNRTKLVHSPSYYNCDYYDIASLQNLLLKSTSVLFQQFDQPRAFFNIKRNLANHLKKQAEKYYDEHMRWNINIEEYVKMDN